MKLLFLALAALFTTSAGAQTCANYYYLQNNKTVEMTIYNKKGKASGKQVYTVKDVQNGGNTTTAVLNSEMFDTKGRSLAKGKSSIKCTDGVMMIDMKMVMPQQQAGPMASTEVKAEDFYMEYPSQMNIGDALKDGKLAMDMNTNGLKSSMNMTVQNRKVEGKETITTSAGSWECYKISYLGKVSMKIMGINKNMDINGIEWFAPDFGVVKTSSEHGGTEITAVR